jgi:glutamine kinase
MKSEITTIILGAGKEAEDIGFAEKSIPTSLIADQSGMSVLGWTLNALHKNNIDNITFVGGYEIENIGQEFPLLDFIYNANWNNSGVLESLYHAKHLLSGPLILVYGDIVFTAGALKKIITKNSHSINIGMDLSYNRSRVGSGKTGKNLVRVEKNNITDIGFLMNDSTIDGEFIGLAYFDAKATGVISDYFNIQYPLTREQPYEQAEQAKNGYLTDLLRHMKDDGIQIHGVNVENNWSEITDNLSLARFVLGTKSSTLEKLASSVKKSKLCDQITFTVKDWDDNNQLILSQVNDRFNSTIAIRSSSFLEDSFTLSNAGAFESILNVDSSDSEEIVNAIKIVIDSYTKNGNIANDDNQILVQRMVADVIMSGVCFTRDIDTGAPYYTISFDDSSGSTDTVTSGASNDIKTIVINRAIKKYPSNTHIETLLGSIREIESLLAFDCLDIEFAVDTNNDIYILQCRPITTLVDSSIKLPNNLYLSNIYENLSTKFTSDPYLHGSNTVYADMPDWNPAEMIGTHPRPLAYSLYDSLIMKKTWREARALLGYYNPQSTRLMMMVSGYAYVDVRASFNNLTPIDIPGDLFEKLINYYIEKLKLNPELHDKVEFEILYTCLDTSFDERSIELLEYGFSDADILILRKSLFTLTNNIISGNIVPISDLVKLMNKREEHSKKILESGTNSNDKYRTIGLLLDNCVTSGTIPFSILARYAFIANSLLRSLAKQGALTSTRLDLFFNSIESIATELVSDVGRYYNGIMDKEIFLEKFGHLRPGTYDITSLNYSENFENYFSHRQQSQKHGYVNENETFHLTDSERNAINERLLEYEFSFDAEELFDFSRQAITLREYGKYEFTKSINNIFNIIIEIGSQMGFSRDDLSFLSIGDFLSNVYTINPADIKDKYTKTIHENKKEYARNRLVRLPHILISPDSIDVIRLPENRPNYITQGKVTAEIVQLDNFESIMDISGKIVLIEGADPGYDWIFTHKIVGLITKYGGSASHMTIRANEFNLPSAIGCGERLFSKISRARTIELNCAEKYINVH